MSKITEVCSSYLIKPNEKGAYINSTCKYKNSFLFSNHGHSHDPIINRHQWESSGSCYKIVWVNKSTDCHIINEIEQPLLAGQFFILTPEDKHEWQENALFSGVLCEFSILMLDNVFKERIKAVANHHSPSNNSRASFPQKNNRILLDQLAMLLPKEIENETRFEVIRTLFMTFLHLLLPEENNLHPVPKHIESIKKLNNLIDCFYHQETGIHFYAQQLNMSIKQLNIIAKSAYNKTVPSLIHERIILDAKKKLQQPDASIKTIAYQLGFEDPSYFSRFFRRYTGYSPNQYRAKLQ